MNQASVVRILLLGMLLTGVGSGFVSCRQDPLKDLSVEDSQVFITNYDRSVRFSSYRTFSLPDSVVVLSNDRQQTSLEPTEQRVLERVAQAFTARGFERASRTSLPDLGLAVARVNDTYVGVTSTPMSPYYMDYWGFGGYGYGYYPYYPDYYSFYQVNDRYWIIQLVDLRNRDAGNRQVNVIWQAEIRGDGIFDDASVDRVISAVFEQSPYLRANE